MIVRHFIRVPVGSTVYCDNQPVKILEKGYALALCDVNGKRVYITCYDLEKKPFVRAHPINQGENSLIL